MYTIQVKCSNQFGYCLSRTENQLLFAVVETPDEYLKHSSYMCLQRAMYRCGTQMAKGSTLDIAKYVHDEIQSGNDVLKGEWLFFTSILCTDTFVEVSNASANRIYVECSNQSSQIIYEQTLEHDHEAQSEMGIDDMSKYMHRANIITRCIGAERNNGEKALLPECRTLAVAKPYQVSLFSSSYYQNHSESELNLLKENRNRKEPQSKGLFSSFEVI